MTLSRRSFTTLASATGAALLSGGLPVIMQARAAADGFTELKISTDTPQAGARGQGNRAVDLQRGVPRSRDPRQAQRRVRVRLINGLDEPTMLHWHGIRIENAMDGSPLTQNPVRSGREL
jgi:FtsP/CotA-like multicopper oxidase with cupredoxin domain